MQYEGPILTTCKKINKVKTDYFGVASWFPGLTLLS